MNFVSNQNPYKLGNFSFRDDLLSVVAEAGQQVTYLVRGTIEFFRDGNGVGDLWTGYRTESVALERVDVLSDEPLELNHDYVLELLASEQYKNLVNYYTTP